MPWVTTNMRPFRAKLVKGLRRNVLAASIELADHMKAKVGVDGTGKADAAQGRDKAGRFTRVRKGLIYGANPSLPGEPPHKQHGDLQGSIGYQLDAAEPTAKVGSFMVGDEDEDGKGANYPLHLERGTRRMKARPWLRPSLDELRDRIAKILSTPIR